MTRSDAITALEALPVVTRIVSADADVIVIESPHDRFSDQEYVRIADLLRQVWPDGKVVVLDEASRTMKLVVATQVKGEE